MPVTITKTKSGKYQVKTPHGVKAKGTTKKKAESQKRLLYAVEHGWKPTGKPARKRTPSAQQGMPYVPRNMQVNVHRGEAIIPAQMNPFGIPNVRVNPQLRTAPPVTRVQQPRYVYNQTARRWIRIG